MAIKTVSKPFTYRSGIMARCHKCHVIPIRMISERQDYFSVCCPQCAASSIGLTGEDAIETWNKYQKTASEPVSNASSPTNRDRLLSFHRKLCQEAYDLMVKKNHDYAGASGDDPFANFRRVESMGVCSVERGFLVRIIDKLSRLSTFCESGTLLVKDEMVIDVLRDMINYPVLMGRYLEQKEEETKTVVRCPKCSTEMEREDHRWFCGKCGYNSTQTDSEL